MWKMFRLPIMIAKRTPDLLTTLQTIYDFLVSCNLFSKAEMRQYDASGNRWVNRIWDCRESMGKGIICAYYEMFLFVKFIFNLPIPARKQPTIPVPYRTSTKFKNLWYHTNLWIPFEDSQYPSESQRQMASLFKGHDIFLVSDFSTGCL